MFSEVIRTRSNFLKESQSQKQSRGKGSNTFQMTSVRVALWRRRVGGSISSSDTQFPMLVGLLWSRSTANPDSFSVGRNGSKPASMSVYYEVWVNVAFTALRGLLT